MPLSWLTTPIVPPCPTHRAQAEQRQQQLTKPQGSLGRLETLAIELAALQHTQTPRINLPHIVIFAADHGIAAEGVSAFPQIVTQEMIRNFSRGGAAICVLAKQFGASLHVINLGTVDDMEALPGVFHLNIAPGTRNFAHEAAMSETMLTQALNAGKESVDQALQHSCDLFIAGEMGIANTTAATALSAILLDQDAAHMAGPGTGLNTTGVTHKVAVINNARRYHQLHARTAPLVLLQTVGGLEIAAITAALLRCGQKGLPALVDGYICSVAALLACTLQPELRPWLFFSHQSAEPGHRHILHALDAKPLLDLGLRLGEGSGAALALPLLQAACALHNTMVTFTEAAVSTAHALMK